MKYLKIKGNVMYFASRVKMVGQVEFTKKNTFSFMQISAEFKLNQLFVI